MHPSEKKFAKVLESQGKSYIYHPRRFEFNGTSYEPDFYCPGDNIYYEVKTTTNLNRLEKILKFKKYYPDIKLKVVSKKGYPYFCPTSDNYIAKLEDILHRLKSMDLLDTSGIELENLSSDLPYIKGVTKIHISSHKIKEIEKIKEKLGMQ